MTVENSLLPAEKATFTEINLSEIKQQKLPKRLVYFSDGVLEEYSTDEDEGDCVNSDTQPLIDPKTLPWVPYFGYMIWWLGSQALSACDYLGEHLAWFLGITSPKFQYEIDQYQKMTKEIEELEKHTKAENAGWSANPDGISRETVERQPRYAASNNLDMLKNEILQSIDGAEQNSSNESPTKF